MPGGMSVESRSPCWPVTWNFNPLSSLAVAGGFFERAFSGACAKTFESFSTASRTDMVVMTSFGTVRPSAILPVHFMKLNRVRKPFEVNLAVTPEGERFAMRWSFV
jgi:hypothetical protein